MARVLDQVEADRVWTEVEKYLEEIRSSVPEEIRSSVPEDAQELILPDEDDGMSEGD